MRIIHNAYIFSPHLLINMLHLNPMHPIKPRHQTTPIPLQMLIITRQQFPQEFTLSLGLGFYHVTAVVGVEEELTGFGIRDELDEVKVSA